jgi:hypothetical protein
MKISFGFFVTLAVLILVMLLTMCNSCTKYVPYSASGSKGAPFEGFRAHRKSVEYTTYPDNVSIDSMNSRSIAQAPVNNTCTKVFGFGGLQCSPEFNDNNLDIYSRAKGDQKCLFQSSGMSNSMGPLCLDEKMNSLLQTRGGNQTGSSAVIGK